MNIHPHRSNVNEKQKEMREVYRNGGLPAVYVASAEKHLSKENKERWRSAVFCSMVVGKYGKGLTKSLAESIGRSPDTIEDRAHGYTMFRELCEYKQGEFRQFVFFARRLPYINFSHFRELHDKKKQYGLGDNEILDLLMDVVKAEGSISSRGLGAHIEGKLGKEKTWLYHAERIAKEIEAALSHPNTPSKLRKTLLKVKKILPTTGDNKSNRQ